jgi:succinate dehydrogenase/fumarate reductase cytochrome b subunit
MAGNTQMNDNERGLFSLLHGITGMLIATVLLLTILAVLVFNAVVVQQRESQNFYKVNQDLSGLKAVDRNNHKQYELVGK